MPADPLAASPPCPECGGVLRECRQEPERDAFGEYARLVQWVECTAETCGWSYWGPLPLTLRTAPWTAPALAAVLEVVERHVQDARHPSYATPEWFALTRLRDKLAGPRP